MEAASIAKVLPSQPLRTNRPDRNQKLQGLPLGEQPAMATTTSPERCGDKFSSARTTAKQRRREEGGRSQELDGREDGNRGRRPRPQRYIAALADITIAVCKALSGTTEVLVQA